MTQAPWFIPHLVYPTDPCLEEDPRRSWLLQDGDGAAHPDRDGLSPALSPLGGCWQGKTAPAATASPPPPRPDFLTLMKH